MDRRSLSEDSAELETKDSAALIEGDLRVFTPARVSLARTGNSITTRNTLAFARDHAQARDAVHAHLSLPTLLNELRARGLEAVTVKSAASDRSIYLRRPDLGRILSEAAKTALQREDHGRTKPQFTIILADGLSALAVDRNALAVVDALLPLMHPEWDATRIVIAEQARVALGDEIGAALGSQLTVMLIGERPGLSAADSLGAYITWAPRIGRTNAERNCISNIRAEGLSPRAAAQRIAFFATEAKRIGQTGTALKDPSDPLLLDEPRHGT